MTVTNFYNYGTMNDVQDGAVQNNYYYGVKGEELNVEDAAGDEDAAQGEGVPECLRTEKAVALWQKAQAQGWVNEAWQPLLSRPLAALLADRMAEVLGIASKWKVFEQLWHRKNMRNDYNTALDQQQCDEYMKKFKRIIA